MSRRQRVTHFSERRYPFPVPNGWFIVAEAADIEPGEVRALYYFGRDLVLYRARGRRSARDGRALPTPRRASRGRWSGGGRLHPLPVPRMEVRRRVAATCVEIPYGDMKVIPSKAHGRSYPTLERNHMIWAWYHANGRRAVLRRARGARVPRRTTGRRSSCVTSRSASHAQDMAENNVDFSHFRYVHGTDAIPEDEFVTEGTYKRTIGMDGNFVREGYGLGLGVLRVKGYVTFLSSTTPIDENNVHVRWIFTSPKSNGEDAALQAAESFCAGVSQDIPIWENKMYRDPPIITKTEKLILEHRRWSEQFYS